MTTFSRWAGNEQGTLVRSGITYFTGDGSGPDGSSVYQEDAKIVAQLNGDGTTTEVWMDPGSIDEGWSINPDPVPQDGQPVTIDTVISKVVRQEKTVFGGRMVVVCLTMQNGFLVTGEVTCFDAEHFDETEGFDMALDRALEKAFALEMYLHRQREFEKAEEAKKAEAARKAAEEEDDMPF